MRFCSLVRSVGIETGLLLAFSLIAACTGGESPRIPPTAIMPSAGHVSEPAPLPIPVQGQNYQETGMAAWYGRELQGKKTANGEVFDMDGLSAAHRTLPFGTVVRVTSLDNFGSIIVRINDRGPFLKNRFLDLSYGAAKELGFVSQGTSRVKIETIAALRGRAQYTVLAAVFTEEENARLLKERLNTRFGIVSIAPFETNNGMFYRVRVGDFASVDRAEQVAVKLALEGLEPFVLKKDW